MTPIGPRDALVEPRFANISTFARLPRADQVDRVDIAILGVPFDAGVSYRPGARFGPHAIRAGSQLLRPFDPGLGIAPFGRLQVADAGDLAVTPFSIPDAIAAIEEGARAHQGSRLVALGGDHTIALPLIRAVAARTGPVALIHLDAHLDTWDTYFDAPYTHGTPFRRAFEEGLLLEDASVHVGTRGPLYAPGDLDDDARFGFRILSAEDLMALGPDRAAAIIKERVQGHPAYLSIDIDVLDPAHAPGTGTPEAGGPSSREILRLLRQLAGIALAGADLVEVAPSYDHAEITAIAASHLVYTMIGLMALAPGS
jgi:agmatinase